MKPSIKHFYNTADFSQKEIHSLIDLAIAIKKGKVKPSLKNKTLAMLFFNPSLRTRVSFAVGMQKLGGNAFDVSTKEGGYTFEFGKGAVMDKATIEHVKEAAQVLSRYVDAIAIRSSHLITSDTQSVEVPSWKTLKQDLVLKSFMEYATVPVINMESNAYHPCQALGDAMTIKEKLGKTKGKKYVLTWSHHPKALPMATPNSQILAACDLGMNVMIAHPKGWELDSEILTVMEKRAKLAGGSVAVLNSQNEAVKDAHIVCAKSWGALQFYGNWNEEKKMRGKLKGWIVDKDLMEKTDHGLFMHCLPVRRNVEVTDAVIDGKESIVIDEAENRMWAQMALLSHLLI